jgi:hypothetical protein
MKPIPFHRVLRALAILGIAIATLTLVAAGAAAPKADGDAPLTKEQWAKIVKRMDENGQTRDLPFKVAEHLGLTKGAQVVTVRELAFEREGYQHGIYRSVDRKDDRIILAFRTPEKRWTAFLADSRFTLIVAVVWNAGETPERWPNDEALPAFNNELGYWSVIAELL